MQIPLIQKEKLVLGIALLVGVYAYVSFLGSPHASLTDTITQRDTERAFSTMAVPFIQNIGQADDRVTFYAKLKTGNAFIDTEGVLTYDFSNGTEGFVLKEKFVTDNDLNASGLEKNETTVSSFIGNDPDKWKSDIPNYNSITLGEVFNGIRVDLKAKGKNIEKIFRVGPEADPSLIKLSVEGAEVIEVNEEGELSFTTQDSTVKMTKPTAYQEINGERTNVEVTYTLFENKQYGFTVGQYDTTKELIIDPLVGSTFLGGTNWEGAREVLGGNSALIVGVDTGDSQEYVFVTGYTESTDFPTTAGVYQPTKNGAAGAGDDIFVSKFNLGLTSLVASTYLGGTGVESESILAMAPDGNIFIVGNTRSSDFPATAGAYDTTLNGSFNVFVAKMNPSLTSLLAATYLGNASDWGNGLAFGTTGCPVNQLTSITPPYCVYVGSDGDSVFPSTPINLSAGYDTTGSGFANIAISLFDDNLSNQYFVTTFIGSGNYYPALAVGSTGDLFVQGGCHGSNPPTFPIVRANGATPSFQETSGGSCDTFVARFSSDLTTL
ncbi:MAG TPA: hypothetical protein VI588_03520, partial [Candidatus Gracilibacteria bacterium]|nr:hypothetical protein [Candidatus Gracilibacteria bacterium]